LKIYFWKILKIMLNRTSFSIVAACCLLALSACCCPSAKDLEKERARQCVQENLVTQAGYQNNSRLASIDSRLNCSEYFKTNLAENEEQQIERYFALRDAATEAGNKNSPYVQMVLSRSFRDDLRQYNRCLSDGNPHFVCGADTRKLIRSCMPKMDDYLKKRLALGGPQAMEREEALWSYSEDYINNLLAERGRSGRLLRDQYDTVLRTQY